MSKSTITIDVHTDNNRIPDSIAWSATDTSIENAQKAKAMMISFWDGAEKAALRIDLWTKDMMVEDMNVHVHQTLLKMADTYLRATKNSDTAKLIEDFSAEFASKVGIVKK